MINNELIAKITQWLEDNIEIEMKFRKIQKDYPDKGPGLLSQNILYRLWQEEAKTDNYPLILIENKKEVDLYLVNMYFEEQSFFSGYLICTITGDIILESEDIIPFEDNLDLWECSIGVPTPNEIIPYELAEELDLIDDKDTLDLTEEIMGNVVESRYVDFFLSTLNHSYYYGYISITDFDQELLSFEQFLDFIMDETRVSFPMYEDRDELEDTFASFYYKNKELIPLTNDNYFTIIQQSEVIIFFTEDKDDALNLYHQMIERIEKEDLENQNKLEKHHKYRESLE